MAEKNPMRATISPGLAYRDAKKAIDWLCEAFGFERKEVFEGENGTIAHAELTFKNGMVMLNSVAEYPGSDKIKHPSEIGNVATQYINVIVDDTDAHYARAKKMGAKIVMDIEDKHYGGRGYTCQDIEGYMWSFGSYDPWKSKG